MKVMRTFKGSFVNGHLHMRLVVLRLWFLLTIGLTTKISKSIMTVLYSENFKLYRISIKNIKNYVNLVLHNEFTLTWGHPLHEQQSLYKTNNIQYIIKPTMIFIT